MTQVPSTGDTGGIGSPGGAAAGVLSPGGSPPPTGVDPAGVLGDPETRGATRLSPVVVEKIARRAAGEVESVVPIGTPIFGGGLAPAPRTRAEVRGAEAEVAISVPVHYPIPLREVGDRVRSHVAERILEFTGLRVTRVDVETAPMRVDRQQRRVV